MMAYELWDALAFVNSDWISRRRTFFLLMM